MRRSPVATLTTTNPPHFSNIKRMAGFGKWEESWKEFVKASVLHGTEKFVAGILKELQGDPREQTGIRQKERLSLEWSDSRGSRESLESALGSGVPPKRQRSSGSGVSPRAAACGNDSA